MSNSDRQFGILNEQEKAANFLDTVLEETSESDIARIANQSAVEHELEKKRLLEPAESNRERSRVFIVTSDLSILDEQSLANSFYVSLSAQFDEIHVCITVPLKKYKKTTKRFGKNLWLYTTGHIGWYKVPLAVRSLAKDQLTFADGFRPDFIVATDPFESGLGAYLVASKYNRPFQVHVTFPFWSSEFKKRPEYNKWRIRIANYVLKRTDSIRTSTNDIKTYLKKKYAQADNISVLPRHYSIKEVVEASDKNTSKDLFPQFALVILYVGKLDHKSTLFRTIDASRSLLQSSGTVLVVVGEGAAKSEFQKRAEIFGINQQIIFKPGNADIISIMKSSDVLVCADTTETSDEVVIKAAAVGLPLIVAKTQLREDLFADGEEAFLCDPEDTAGFTTKLSNFVNNNALRKQFQVGARESVTTRLLEDSETFYQAYRNSLEGVFVGLSTAEETVSEDELKMPTSSDNPINIAV